MESVTINNPTEGEIEPTTEEAQVEQPQAEQVPEPPSEDRPEWLPEKFSSPEEMAKAYGELENKLSSNQSDNSEQTEEVVEVNTSEVLTYASEEFVDQGQLSEQTYETLQEFGISKDIVNAYIEGQKALTAQRDSEIKAAANGKYEEMGQWASDNLSQAEIDAFNSVVEGGDINAAKMAVSGMYARYASNNPSAPNLTMGNTSGSSTMPFSDWKEVQRAMSDPRYTSGEKAYHEEVERRIAVSSNL